MIRRIYWGLVLVNLSALAFHAIPWLVMDPSRLSPLRIVCYAIAAAIFATLAWTARRAPAPRADVGIYLYGADGGWRYPAYRQKDT